MTAPNTAITNFPTKQVNANLVGGILHKTQKNDYWVIRTREVAAMNTAQEALFSN